MTETGTHTRKLRILITADAEVPVPPVLYGGIERVIDLHVRELVRRGHDVTLQYAGSSTDRFAALKSGAVDATILTTPYDFQAKTAGYTELDDLTKHLPATQYAGNGVVVGTQWAAKNRTAPTAVLLR